MRNLVGGVDVGAAPDGDLVSPGERLQIHVAGGPQPVLPGRRDYRGDLGRAVEQSGERRPCLVHSADEYDTTR